MTIATNMAGDTARQHEVVVTAPAPSRCAFAGRSVEEVDELFVVDDLAYQLVVHQVFAAALPVLTSVVLDPKPIL